MAESSFCSEFTDSDMESLKEAVRAQHQLLQKLYFELDEEREASSSATSEAMSMILRLQSEKAQMKMEASQYRREAEEKLCLADESLAIFEDLIYQKQMEITCLELQVEAYKCKLLGVGCTDLSIPECILPDGLQQQRSEPVIAEIGVGRNVKRQDSLPALYLKEYFPKRSSIQRERSNIPVADLIPKKEVINTNREVDNVSIDFEKKTGGSGGGNLNVYWERIRKLKGQVREISDVKSLHRANSRNRQFRSCSLPPPDPEDAGLTSDGITISVVDEAKYATNLAEKNDVYSLSVQDKFEVPQNSEDCKARGRTEIEQKRLDYSKGEKRNRKAVTEDNLEFQVGDKTEIRNKVPLVGKHKDASVKQRERAIAPSTVSIVSEYQLDIQRLKQRVERLESKESSTRQEVGEPSLMMLKAILSEVNSLQCELRNYKTKSSHLDTPTPTLSLDSVNEAMIHFWL